ncbi:hypothetical protein O6H91_19G006800 [Diphasiastrum complanatum]|uniref:Uncharacterized protein n=1 Tax=Diphasiastrum complanatum TaxID=34168 RepID=A0ACC2ASI1_DIPCM|nr:hypothetical protein O6H91_19G006800 [Diphasiastrum complanatum]
MAMAVPWIGSILFAISALCFEAVSSAAVNQVTDGREVTFGSVIKLQHDRSKFRLHSHEVPYGSGSGQQSVTGFSGVEDSNSYWIVRPPQGASVGQGDEIRSGTILRLQHMKTRRWLHSHLHLSPISGNYEVFNEHFFYSVPVNSNGIQDCFATPRFSSLLWSTTF